MAVELVGTAPLPFKIPQSVLVVIHTPTLDVLLIRRAVDAPDGQAFWQSVTGSKDSPQEDWRDTAVREVWRVCRILCKRTIPCRLASARP